MVGRYDFAGNPRVRAEKIDTGACEHLSDRDSPGQSRAGSDYRRCVGAYRREIVGAFGKFRVVRCTRKLRTQCGGHYGYWRLLWSERWTFGYFPSCARSIDKGIGPGELYGAGSRHADGPERSSGRERNRNHHERRHQHCADHAHRRSRRIFLYRSAPRCLRVKGASSGFSGCRENQRRSAGRPADQREFPTSSPQCQPDDGGHRNRPVTRHR